MKLEDILNMIDENTAVRVTVDGTFIVGHYDGRESIDSKYYDYEVNKMFATTVTAYDALGRAYEKPYISIDTEADCFIEIWHNEDGDDWAQLTISKATGDVLAVMTGGWDADEMTYEAALELIKSEGFTDFDPLWDRYDSWEEYNDTVTVGGAYGYVEER